MTRTRQIPDGRLKPILRPFDSLTDKPVELFGESTACTIAVTSGKGGTGKTFFCANLAASLIQHGLNVLLVDANYGLAHLDVAMNVQPRHTLDDVLAGTATLDDAVAPLPGGGSLLVLGAGGLAHAPLADGLRAGLRAAVGALKRRHDVILLDTGPGISEFVRFVVSLADEVVVVTSPEPSSVASAYAAVKVLAVHGQRSSAWLLVNQVVTREEGDAVMERAGALCERFVGTACGGALRLRRLGCVPFDRAVGVALQRRDLLVRMSPDAPAALAVAESTRQLLRGGGLGRFRGSHAGADA